LKKKKKRKEKEVNLGVFPLEKGILLGVGII